MFNLVDRKLKKNGWLKKEESEFGALYIRRNEKYNYMQCLSIMHKKNKNHIIQSYQQEVNSDGFNNCVGLDYNDMKLALRKYRQLKRKYRW